MGNYVNLKTDSVMFKYIKSIYINLEKNKVLVTGSSGLIGSEVVKYFCEKGSTKPNLFRLRNKYSNFSNFNIDIRDRNEIDKLVGDIRPNVIVHTAAQPSYDKAAEIPFLDFEVNTIGTLNLLQAVRNYCKESPFIHLSTNKVHGDSPNKLDLIELKKR